MSFILLKIYVVIINLVSGLIFAYDKYAAKRNKKRLPEQTLHFFEFIGGVFANIFLIYIIRHKNRKFNYWIWTWLIFIGWLLGLLYFIRIV